MANLRQIKRRIGASKNISKITKAMEMVAASKMRKAQDQATAARPYTRALQNSLQKVSANTDQNLHPLLQTHGAGKDALVIVGTDKGLVGGLNNNLFKASHAWMQAHPNGLVIPVGKKSVKFGQLAGADIYAQFTEFPEKITTDDIVPISTLLTQEFLGMHFKSVTMIYMDFINTLSQEVREMQLLPLQQYSSRDNQDIVQPGMHSEYTFEPSPKKILDELLPYYIENTIYQAFLEARASEHSSRMVAMKNASENAGDLVHELNLEFNKSRQAAITTELLDIATASMTIT